jgi:hypothetical protein
VVTFVALLVFIGSVALVACFFCLFCHLVSLSFDLSDYISNRMDRLHQRLHSVCVLQMVLTINSEYLPKHINRLVVGFL